MAIPLNFASTSAGYRRDASTSLTAGMCYVVFHRPNFALLPILHNFIPVKSSTLRFLSKGICIGSPPLHASSVAVSVRSHGIVRNHFENMLCCLVGMHGNRKRRQNEIFTLRSSRHSKNGYSNNVVETLCVGNEKGDIGQFNNCRENAERYMNTYCSWGRNSDFDSRSPCNPTPDIWPCPEDT